MNVAPLSVWMTGVTHTLLEPSLFPSFKLMVASFLSQTKFLSSYELPLIWQTRDTVLFSSVSITSSVLITEDDWIMTPLERAKDRRRELEDDGMKKG